MVERAESASCKVSADIRVFRSADVTREAFEETEQEGYIPSDQIVGGFSVFKLNGESNASIEEPHVFVEVEEVSDDEESGTTRAETGSIPLDWSLVRIETPDDKFFVPEIRKQSREGPDSSQPGVRQQVFGELVFRHACDRSSDSRNVTFFLGIRFVGFGVKGSIDSNNQRGHFVSKVEVTAEPKWDWGRLISFTEVCPADDNGCHHFEHQEANNTSCLATFGGRPNIQIGAGQTHTSISKEILKFGWRASKRNRKTKAVKWTWEVTHWKNTKPFHDFDRRKNLGDFLTTSLPELPFDDPKDVNLGCGDSVVQASWTVPAEELGDLVEIEWDISVNFSTKLFKLGYFGKVNAEDFRNVDPKTRLDFGVRGYETLRSKIHQSLISK